MDEIRFRIPYFQLGKKSYSMLQDFLFIFSFSNLLKWQNLYLLVLQHNYIWYMASYRDLDTSSKKKFFKKIDYAWIFYKLNKSLH